MRSKGSEADLWGCSTLQPMRGCRPEVRPQGNSFWKPAWARRVEDSEWRVKEGWLLFFPQKFKILFTSILYILPTKSAWFWLPSSSWWALWNGSYKHKTCEGNDKWKAWGTVRTALVVMTDLWMPESVSGPDISPLSNVRPVYTVSPEVWIITHDMTGPEMSITDLQITSHI